MAKKNGNVATITSFADLLASPPADPNKPGSTRVTIIDPTTGQIGRVQYAGIPADLSADGLRKFASDGRVAAVAMPAGGEYIDPISGKPKLESAVNKVVNGSVPLPLFASTVRPIV